MRSELVFLSLLMTIICAQCQISNDDSTLPSTKKVPKHDMEPVYKQEGHVDNDPPGTVTSWNTTGTIPPVSAVPADNEPQTTSTLYGAQERNLSQSTEALSDKEEIRQEGDTQELKHSCQPTQASINDTVELVTTLKPFVETEPPHRCANYASPWPHCELDSAESINHTDFLVESITKVSLSLFQKLTAKDKNVNVVFSPLSVVLILSHLLLGTRGATKEKLQEALFYPNNSDCVHTAINQLGKSKGFILASKIFHQQDIVFHEFFVNDSKEFYNSTPQILSHDASDNVQLINNWVAENTHNKIKKLMDQVPSDVQLILLNAIYLRAKWITKFKMENTKKDKFQLYGADKKTVRVAMMNSEKYPLISFSDSTLGARIGRLRLTDNMSLVIMMPQWPHQTLSNMEAQLSDDVFQQVMSKLYKEPVRPAMVSIPRIKVDTKLDLLELLDKMGLSELFYSPNLCGIAADIELAVSSGTHRSLVEVNEEGVEAAGASSISLSRAYMTFEVRQPFAFFVMNDDPVLPVFMGRIVNPAA
ncbi:plasma protease C1 inhibitor [Microcaecilia unicolor]|uniref:Plasma protease C1 inhibitor n=1 Tax=Microcaecilia unicolor TaxID=1415580 RepID=A0A6P7WFT7_9AMPH|nr:plasma protease C1 inhibitor [Microcaecilia unicolor]